MLVCLYIPAPLAVAAEDCWSLLKLLAVMHPFIVGLYNTVTLEFVEVVGYNVSVYCLYNTVTPPAPHNST